MAAYMRQLSEQNTNTNSMEQLRHNLVRCLNEDITPRQRTMLTMYYVQQLSQKEIARQLNVDRSTVSRTILRGERQLQRCLRYGAERYLKHMK
ncbi:MAG: sigma-70 family RNA polymerase sigma factor [Oscillospiraceae bacterium]|nr:sigma-70 family RNA polymerase sigma factor [Oscillospiraceae bacterium]